MHKMQTVKIWRGGGGGGKRQREKEGGWGGFGEKFPEPTIKNLKKFFVKKK